MTGSLQAAQLCFLTLGLISTRAPAQYTAPDSSRSVLRGVDFSKAQPIAPELTQLFQDCDRRSDYGGCAQDPAHNTTILKFVDRADSAGPVSGPVFFDAKMAIDADGSALSKKAERPNQPETALRFPTTGESLDSERVPYIVMPMGGFRQASGVALGDLAAVVKDGQIHFAIVGDVGPRTHLGEGSMYLHTLFGRHICQAKDEEGNCSQFLDTSLDPPVLYFLFPGTKKLLFDGLSPENINQRLLSVGQQVWKDFLSSRKPEGES